MKKSAIVLSCIFSLSFSSCSAGDLFPSSSEPINPNSTPSTTTYEVSFDSNGGSIIESQTISYGDKIVKPTEPNKYGYDFYRWIYEGEEWDFDNDVVTENITLTAEWSVHVHSVEIILNDTNKGTVVGAGTYEYGEIVELIATPNLGYEFVEWFEEETSVSNTNIYSFSMPDNDIELKVSWDIINYNIYYNLNGGINNALNPSTYTVEEQVLLYNPTKTGYKFIGWETNDKVAISEIPLRSTGDLFLTANWAVDLYQVDLVNTLTDAGTITGGGAYPFGAEVVLTATPNEGYTFVGWRNGQTFVSDIPTFAFIMPEYNCTFTAVWSINSYNIIYDLGGGENSPDNPSTYTVEDTIILQDPTRYSFKFLGWKHNGEEITTINKGTTGDITLVANWANGRYVNIQFDSSMGSVKGGGIHTPGSLVTISITPYEGYVFKYLYQADSKKEPDDLNNYSFLMPNYDLYFTVVFWTQEEEEHNWDVNHGVIPTVDKNTNTIKYGLYPQSVADDYMQDELNSKFFSSSKPNHSSGYYEYEDKFYTRQRASDRPDANYHFNNGKPIEKNKVYWFNCEPITWKILKEDNGEYLLLSEYLIEHSTYSSDYAKAKYNESKIRTWLNNEFYNTAFMFGNEYIVDTIVDNSAATTDGTPNNNECENTVDKVFMLSYQDYVNEEYGLSSNESKKCKVSDYILAWLSPKSADADGYGAYWTRSPTYREDTVDDFNYQNTICCVTSTGWISPCPTKAGYVLVRPAITLKIN